jgi:transcriptional regulator with PAS, ATPase and Fis domain
MEHSERIQTQPTKELAKLREEIGKVKELEHECRQTQEALEKERSFVSAILDTAAALVVVLDTKGRIVRFNHACTTSALFAGRRERCLKRSINQLRNFR